VGNEVVRLEIKVDATGQPVIRTLTEDLSKLSKGKVQLTNDAGNLNRTMNSLQGELTGVAQRFGGVTGSILGGLGPLGLYTAALGGGLTAAAAASLQTFVALANEVRDLSYISGASPEKISGLVDALGDLGISSDTVQTGIAKMSAAIESGSPALARLGLSTRDASGHQKNALTLFYESIDALGGVRGEIERNSLAREIFGRGWTQMIPVIEQGSAALKQMAAESNKVLTAEDLKRAREYQLAIANLGDAFDALKLRVAGDIVVPITMAIKWLTPSGETVSPDALPTTIEEAARKALPGLYRNVPTSYRSYGLYDDPSLHTTGYKTKPVEPLTAGELKQQEEERKRATERALYFLKLDQQVQAQREKDIAEFNAWESKVLADEVKAQEEAAKNEIAAWVKIADAELELAERENAVENELLAEQVKKREEAQKQELEGWVKVAEMEMELADQTARAEAEKYDAMYRKQRETYARMVQATQQVGQNLTRSLDDAFFSVLTGKFKDLGSVAEQFGYSMLRVLTGQMSSGISNYLLGSNGGGGLLGGALAGYGTSALGWLSDAGSSLWGGVSSAASSVGSFLGFLNTGMWNVPDLKGQEWAVLHPGEMVLPPAAAAAIREQGGVRGPWGRLLFGPSSSGASYSPSVSSRASSALAGIFGGTEGRGIGQSPQTSAAGISEAIMGNLSPAQMAVSLAGRIASFAYSSYKMATNPLTAPLTFYGMLRGFGAMDVSDLQDAFGLSPAAARSVASALEGLPSTVTPGFIASVVADMTSYDASAGGMSWGSSYGADMGSERGSETSGTGIGTDVGNEGDGGRDYASGGVFNTTGTTRMTVGEAGRETVAVLRNPREVGSLGGPQVTVNFYGPIFGVDGMQEAARLLLDEFQRLKGRMPGSALFPAVA
jgi:hypothetical protein